MTESPSLAANPGGYDPRFFKIIADVEERHFWFRARARLIEDAAAAVLSAIRPGYQVLEVGCGNGNILRHLARAATGGQVIGLDLFSDGLRFSAERSECPVVCADIMHLPFGTQFQLVGAFDVLEHIPDDTGALDSIRNTLSEGGTLLLTVPADPSLWSYFDEAAHHCRRYTAAELNSKLTSAGFVVTRITAFMAVTFPLLWLWRRMAGRGKEVYRSSQNELKIVPVINSLLNTLLAIERLAIRREGRLPFGSSLLAVAHKPAK